MSSSTNNEDVSDVSDHFILSSENRVHNLNYESVSEDKSFNDIANVTQQSNGMQKSLYRSQMSEDSFTSPQSTSVCRSL